VIGADLKNTAPGVVGGQPGADWFRLAVRLLVELVELVAAGRHAKLLLPAAAEQVLAATTAIVASAVTVRISSAGAITLTAAPTIPDGEDGQIVCLTNVGSANITIQDQGTLAGSNLRLAAAGVALTPRDSLWLRFDASLGAWLQVTPLVGVV
jgi:hypothetical protein